MIIFDKQRKVLPLKEKAKSIYLFDCLQFDNIKARGYKRNIGNSVFNINELYGI